MKWANEYSIGIEEIDNQHKELLALFSAVEDQVKTDQGWSAVHYSILKVIDFARFHFRFEEALMRLYGYPDYEQHCKDHRRILVQADEIISDSLRASAQDDVATYFRDWLVKHIQGSDRGYAAHILGGAKMVAPATGS